MSCQGAREVDTQEHWWPGALRWTLYAPPGTQRLWRTVMTKATVTRLFLGSVVAVVAGAILAFAAVWVGYASGAFQMSGPDVVGIQSMPYAWAIVGIGILALLVMIGGFIGGLVSWIGALLDAAQYED